MPEQGESQINTVVFCSTYLAFISLKMPVTQPMPNKIIAVAINILEVTCSFNNKYPQIN